MDDQLLVRRAAGGDLDSFGQLYDRYFNRVYDFVWRTLRDADGVAAVTERVFGEARRTLRTLPKGASFGPWLFGIAHRETIRRAETEGVGAAGASHEEAFGSFGEPDAYRITGGVPGDGELPGLVWEAVTQLNPRDYALLDLNVRQGLNTSEIATVMGVGRGNAATMVTRMKAAADGVIADYILARQGGEGCTELTRVVADSGFPPYNDEVRRAVDAHARECETCRGEREALGSPLALFASFAAVQAPFTLKAEIWRGLAGSVGSGIAPTGTATAVPRPLPASPYAGSPPPAGAYGGGGGYAGPPVALGGGEDPLRNRILLFAGAAIGLLVFAFAGAMIASSFGGDNDGDGRSGAAATRTANAGAGGSPTTPGVSVETSAPEDTSTPDDDDETTTPTPTGQATEAPTDVPADTPVPVNTATPAPQPTQPPPPPPTDVPDPTNTPSGIPFE